MNEYTMTSEQQTFQQLLEDFRERGRAFNPTPLLKREYVEIPNTPSEDPASQQSSGQSASNVPVASRDEPVLRLMQWNLLAQGLCLTSDGFILCPPPALDQEYRRNRILEELLSYPSDIYCLQEVDQFAFVQEYLGKLGFVGAFLPKPDSPCLYEKNNCGPDGCAIFWRESQLKLLDQSNVILQDDHNQETNQVALVCKFQGILGPLVGKTFICVATHLKSKTRYEELRRQQGKFLEKYLIEMANGLPLILCGDFNADPHEEVISLLKSSQLGLCSAYTLLSEHKTEPPYTTWKVRNGRQNNQSEVCHTIDYIFFSVKSFECLKLLQFPTKADLSPGFLPSYSYPSDHLSLVAHLKLL